VNIDHYRVDRGEEITLININRNKGAELFYEVAQMMPEYKFLAVQGGYGEQIYNRLQNVTIWGNQPDVRNVYKRTKILLMPSQYESWGRTATEAMASGIPCIVSDLPALRENCGDAGIYCSPDRPHQWVQAIQNVMNNYELCSKAAFDRADELRPHDKLINFEQWVTTLLR
jgi:glycosyltransferase involved in cell wall biosynthesis